MKPKNVIVWILLLGIVVLLMSTSVQAKELTEVNASDILNQIRKGEDVVYEKVRIIGELDLSKIELKTVPIARSELEISHYGLEEELKIVESFIEIRYSVFEDDFDFSNTQFRKNIGMYKNSFLGKIDFRGANFTGDAYFVDDDFSGDADFVAVDFSGDAYFVGADFSGDANFWDADFSGDADFKVADFSGDAYFVGADFSGDADFTAVDFNKIIVGWDSLKDALVFFGPTYIQLIKNFREMEQFEDADAAYYQYRQLSQANKKLSFSKLTDVVAGVSCGYGVKPWNAAALAVVIILIFIPIYGLWGGIRQSKENDEKDEEDVSSRRKTWNAFVDAFYFSMVTFTTIGYGDLYPADRYRKVAVMIEGLLGWLLLALFIVTLANVMIRP